jgi:hypothetical protein
VTVALSFDLATVVALADHAAAATHHSDPAGPALRLASSSDGVHLTSSGLPAMSAPAGQPGSLDRMAAFAAQCPPGITWLEQVQLLHSETPLAEPLPLHQPQHHPLIAQLRAGAAAGYTTLTVLLSGSVLDLAVGRRRTRTRSHATATRSVHR